MENENNNQRPYQQFMDEQQTGGNFSGENSENNAQGSYQNFSNGFVPSQENNQVQPLMEVPMTLGDWVVTLLISAIPCVNIIMMFIWAFSSNEKKGKSNYAKATLIWWGVGLVLCILFSVLIWTTVASVMSNISNYGMYY